MNDTEFQIRRADNPLRRHTMRNERLILTMRAQMAKDLIFTITASQVAYTIQGRRDNIDPPATIVNLACTIAQVAFAEFEERGWTLLAPSLAELDSEPPPEKVGF